MPLFLGTSYPPRPVVPQNTPSTKSGNDDESKPAGNLRIEITCRLDVSTFLHVCPYIAAI